MLRKRPSILAHPVSAAAANLTLMGFYWLAVYPANGGKMVKPLAALVLSVAGTATAAVFGGLPSALVWRYWGRPEGGR